MLALLVVGVMPSGRPGGIELVNATPRLQEHVVWAIESFTSHGLDAPYVSEIAFSPEHPRCSGLAGYFFPHDNAILLCFDAQTMATGSDERLHDREVRVLLHELAHAWMSSHVSTEQQTVVTSMLGARSWDDPGDPWCHRGHELAAEAFVWWLTDGQVLPRPLASLDPDHLDAVISVLIGR